MTGQGEPGSQDKGFYDTLFSGSAEDLHARIRAEAFGEEIGQNSWLTADEHRRFFGWLELGAESKVLEVASGAGGPALFMVAETGCSVTGVDLHEDGVVAANGAAAERGVGDRATFMQADARASLPFEDGSFDAVLCIDSINHIYERAQLLSELWRVLRGEGRLLYTDPIVVTGMLRREEMIIRSGSMGEFVFTAPGTNERLLSDAGFVDVRTEDVTENMATVALTWRDSRERHAYELAQIEGAAARDSLQEFLAVVHLLASERRLSRFAYLARKPARVGV